MLLGSPLDTKQLNQHHRVNNVDIQPSYLKLLIICIMMADFLCKCASTAYDCIITRRKDYRDEEEWEMAIWCCKKTIQNEGYDVVEKTMQWF